MAVWEVWSEISLVEDPEGNRAETLTLSLILAEGKKEHIGEKAELLISFDAENREDAERKYYEFLEK